MLKKYTAELYIQMIIPLKLAVNYKRNYLSNSGKSDSEKCGTHAVSLDHSLKSVINGRGVLGNSENCGGIMSHCGVHKTRAIKYS